MEDLRGRAHDAQVNEASSRRGNGYLGRQRIFRRIFVKESSLALLNQMAASPGRKLAIFSGVSAPSEAFASHPSERTAISIRA